MFFVSHQICTPYRNTEEQIDDDDDKNDMYIQIRYNFIHINLNALCI